MHTPIIMVSSSDRAGVSVGIPGRQAAVLLDRDGVVNTTDGFVNTPEDLDRQLIPSSLEAIARLTRETDLPVILVTNQGGIGDGRLSPEMNRAILERLALRVHEAGGHLDAIYVCPNGTGFQVPEGREDARKQGPGLLLEAARHFGLDLEDIYMVGDMTTDIAAGEAANPKVITVLVETGFGGKDGKAQARPDHTSPDLSGAVDWIIAREKVNNLVESGQPR